VQKLSGDAVVALRPADRVFRLQNRSFHRPLRSTNHTPSISPNRETRVAQKDNREDHCTPGKDPNGVPWKNLSRYCTVRRLPIAASEIHLVP
jgi:hypothetical protein